MFCLGGILFYFLFQWIIDRDFNKRLHERKNYYIDVLMQSDSLLHYQQFSANSIAVTPTAPTRHTDVEVVSDTILFDRIENKFNRYRQVALTMVVRNQYYKVQVRRALVERKDIIQGVIILEVLLFVSFVVILNLLNRQLSKSLWRPFYAILEKLGRYGTERPEPMVFSRSNITEFNELSAVIEQMTVRIHQEFRILKEFTENASHEIQTPLAIVKSKLEILLQSPGLAEDQMDLINSASIAATRLSKLNEALLILSRIENKQFHVVETIRLGDILEKQLEAFEELITIKKLNIERNFRSELTFPSNPFLADIFIENLFINAIKHNHPEGTIRFETVGTKFILSNTGDPPGRNPADLFQRFVKSNTKSQSLGLGLSIVKAICDTYQYTVSYEFEKGYHRVAVDFRPKEFL